VAQSVNVVFFSKKWTPVPSTEIILFLHYLQNRGILHRNITSVDDVHSVSSDRIFDRSGRLEKFEYVEVLLTDGKALSNCRYHTSPALST
jgi:hypothetical protein